MEFNENVITIFDDLAKRFGIIIDWSKDNVIPYLLDIFNRWRTYKIIVYIIPILLLICLIFITIKLYLSINKERKTINKELPTLNRSETYKYKYHKVTTYFHTAPVIEFNDTAKYIFGGILMLDIGLIILNLFTVFGLLQAIFVPEVLFYEEFLA